MYIILRVWIFYLTKCAILPKKDNRLNVPMIKIYFLLFIIFFSALPFLGYAQQPNPGQVNNILYNVFDAVEVLVTIFLTLAVAVFGWGIVRLIFAAGDPRKIQEAKGIVTWGVIAMFILGSIYGIVAFIQGYLGIDSGSGIIHPPVFEGGSGPGAGPGSGNGGPAGPPPPPLPPSP